MQIKITKNFAKRIESDILKKVSNTRVPCPKCKKMSIYLRRGNQKCQFCGTEVQSK